MEKFVLILSQIFMYVGFLVLLYIVYRVKNLKVQAPLDFTSLQTVNNKTSSPVVIASQNYKYEYLVIDIMDSFKEDEEQLNKLGNEGWELILSINNKKTVSTHGFADDFLSNRYILKRLKISSHNTQHEPETN